MLKIPKYSIHLFFKKRRLNESAVFITQITERKTFCHLLESAIILDKILVQKWHLVRMWLLTILTGEISCKKRKEKKKIFIPVPWQKLSDFPKFINQWWYQYKLCKKCQAKASVRVRMINQHKPTSLLTEVRKRSTRERVTDGSIIGLL